MRLASLLPALLISCLPAFAGAQDLSDRLPEGAYTGPVEPVDPSAVPPQFAAAVAQLHPRHGTITLGDKLATLMLPKDLEYLPPDEANLYMNRIVGYPRQTRNLGLILPSNVAIGSPASWSAILTWRDDGYVKEDKAALDAGALMAEIKKGNEDYLAKAKSAGFEKTAVTVVGWADEPAYDASRHALIWGTEIMEGDSEDHKLNYFVRFLSRQNTVALSSVARFEQLPMLESSIPQIVKGFRFSAPHRYEDIKADDKAAPYSLADLITGNLPHGKPDLKVPNKTAK